MKEDHFMDEMIEHLLIMFHEANRVANIFFETIKSELSEVVETINLNEKEVTRQIKEIKGKHYQVTADEICKHVRKITDRWEAGKHQKAISTLLGLAEEDVKSVISQGMTLEQAKDNFVLRFKHKKNSLQYLLNKSGEKEDLSGSILCLIAGIHFYADILDHNFTLPLTAKLTNSPYPVEFKTLLNKETLVHIFKVDRELAYIKEDVATWAAGSEKRMTDFKKIFRPRILQEINSADILDNISELIAQWESEGASFRNFEEFKLAVQKRTFNFKGKKISKSSLKRFLKELGIETKSNLLKKHPNIIG